MYSNAATDYLFTGRVVSGEYVYPSAEQNAVIVFNSTDPNGNFFLSAKDGDFTTGGMSISSMACNSEDITIGNAPAAVLAATLMNPRGLMESLVWGYGAAYIGVVTATASADTYNSLPCPCHVYVNNVHFSINANGVAYRNTSNLGTIGGSPLAVIANSDGSDVYFVTTNGVGRRVNNAFSVITPNAAQSFLVGKYGNEEAPIGVALDANGCPVAYNDVANSVKTTYTYIPMGVYDFSNVDAFGITFNAEAYDRMTLFDADATDWVQTLDFATPKTLSALIAELMTEMGMSYTISPSAVNTGLTLSENPITSYSVTYRQVLKWLAEAIGCNARISRTGSTVEFVVYNPTPITDSNGNTIVISCDTIVGNSRTKSRNAVPAINQVVCYNTVGAGYEYHSPSLSVGTTMVPLYVVANPFVDPSVSEQPVEDLCGLADDIPGYNPTTLNVVCSDPRIDAGDFITVTEKDNVTTYVIPVMTQTLFWNGSCRTQFGATGNQVRQIPEAITDSSDLSGVVSSNPAAVVNMIQAHGISADWITTGKLTVLDNDDNVIFDADKDTKSVQIGGFAVTDDGLSNTNGQVSFAIDPRNYITIANTPDDIDTIVSDEGVTVGKISDINVRADMAYDGFFVFNEDGDEGLYTANWTRVLSYNGDGTSTTPGRIQLSRGALSSTLEAGIGERVHSDTSLTLTSGTTLQYLADFSLTKGTWMVSVSVRFASNATGRRAISLSNTSGGSAMNLRWGNNATATNGTYTYLHLASSIVVTGAQSQYYINGYQNSGTGLTVEVAWDAVRVY